MKTKTLFLLGKFTLFLLLFSCQISYGQTINVTTQPLYPTSTDTVLVISDISYYGNCPAGLVNHSINQNGYTFDMMLEYCGYGDTTLCNSIDTFTLGVLPNGPYTVNLEYHQGTVCLGGFDTIIGSTFYLFQIKPLSIGAIETEEMIHIFPNPTGDFIKLSSPQSIKGVTLFDMNGKENRIPFKENSIDMRALIPGCYILNIELIDGSFVTKEVIKK